MSVETTLTAHRRFSTDDCSIVRLHDRPPAACDVFAASMEEVVGGARLSVARGKVVLPDGTALGTVHFYTLQVGSLIVHITRPEPPTLDYRSLPAIAVHEDFKVKLFMPSPEFFWPPKRSLNQETLLELTRRGLDMPEEWEPPERPDAPLGPPLRLPK